MDEREQKGDEKLIRDRKEPSNRNEKQGGWRRVNKHEGRMIRKGVRRE